jgi:type IV secretion system protein VirB6
MEPSVVFQTLFQYVDAAVAKYVTDVAAITAQTFRDFGYQLIMLYVILWGWSMMRGMISEPVTDAMWRIFKIVTIFSLATSSALYASHVSNFLFTWPTALASKLNGGSISVSDSAQMLDQMLDKGNTLAGQAWEKANLANIGGYILACLVYVMTWLTTVLTGIIIITAKYGLAITLAIGPLFILGLMFESTRRWFDAWLGTVITEGLAIVLSVMAATLMFKLMDATFDATQLDANANSGIATMSAISALVIYGIACIFTIFKMPVLAGSIGGSLSTGSASPLGWAYDKIKNAVSDKRPIGNPGRKTAGRLGQGRGEGGRVEPVKRLENPMPVYRKITSRRKH